jgi:hypothetical protein
MTTTIPNKKKNNTKKHPTNRQTTTAATTSTTRKRKRSLSFSYSTGGSPLIFNPYPTHHPFPIEIYGPPLSFSHKQEGMPSDRHILISLSWDKVIFLPL